MRYGIQASDRRGKRAEAKPCARLSLDRRTSKSRITNMRKLIAIAAALGFLGALALTPASAAPAGNGVTGTDISAQDKKPAKKAKKPAKKKMEKKSSLNIVTDISAQKKKAAKKKKAKKSKKSAKKMKKSESAVADLSSQKKKKAKKSSKKKAKKPAKKTNVILYRIAA